MKIGVVELYRDVLPRTNCGECGTPTCIAFASQVVVEGRDLADCPHMEGDVLASTRALVEEQRARGEGTKRDLAADALAWARSRATSMALEDMPARIGGRIEGDTLVLPYFDGYVRVTPGGLLGPDGAELGAWEQVLVYNHMAQGGSAEPTGEWIGIEQLPGSTSKVKSLAGTAENPIAERFSGRSEDLVEAARRIGGRPEPSASGADATVRLGPLPRVPVLLLMWEGDEEDGLDARVKMLFDSTVNEHLDIESIVFLGERIARLLADQSSGIS